MTKTEFVCFEPQALLWHWLLSNCMLVVIHLVTAMILCRLDYCNFVLASLHHCKSVMQ